jgi:hypothetical protein
MKEYPILFSTPMVKAILEGRKSMTRRTNRLDTVNIKPNKWTLLHHNPQGKWQFRDSMGIYLNVYCPYGQLGDRLWVRETYYPTDSGIIYKANMDDADIPKCWA